MVKKNKFFYLCKLFEKNIIKMLNRNFVSHVKKYPQRAFQQLSVLKFYHQYDQKMIEAPLREPITQWSHALQTANCVRLECERNGGTRDKYLEVAAVLHDLGHFVCYEQTLTPSIFRKCVDVNSGIDDLHEKVGACYLASMGYPKAITEPIRYHGIAKIWLCDSNKTYYDKLSIASKQSLSMQKANLNARNTYNEFLKSPYANKAVLLRRCDDMGKETVNVEYPYYKTIDDVLALMYSVLF